MGLKRTSKLIYDIATARHPRVLYVGGWQGHENLGDEALFAALKGYLGNVGMVPFSRGECPVCLKKLLPEVSHAFLAGGTLAGRCDSALKRAEQSLRLCGKLSFFGGGFSNLEFWKNYIDEKKLVRCRQDWQRVLNRCDYVGVRGPLSMQSLVDLGVKQVEVLGDTALYYAKDEIPVRQSSAAPVLGINIGTTSGIGLFTDSLLLKTVIDVARAAAARKWAVKWMVVWPEDLSMAEIAAKAAGTQSSILFYGEPGKYLESVSEVDVFVGVKLHSVILAQCAYIPSVMLEYRPKCRDHMMAVQQEANCLNLNDHEPTAIWRRVEELYDRRAEVSLQLFNAVQPLRQLQHERCNELKSTFK